MFAEALRARHRAWASRVGLDAVEFGAITFVQRFGGSLNLNVHLHVVVVDGVFSRNAAGALELTTAPPPSWSEMMMILRTVAKRVGKRLAKVADTAVADGALGRCAQLALFRGDVRKIANDAATEPDEPETPAPRRELCPLDRSAVWTPKPVRPA